MKPKRFEIWLLGLLNPLETSPTVRECVLSHFSCVRLFATLWTLARQASLSMGFSRHENWSGLPYPPPGDLADLRIKPVSPVLQADSLPTGPPSKPLFSYTSPYSETPPQIFVS